MVRFLSVLSFFTFILFSCTNKNIEEDIEYYCGDFDEVVHYQLKNDSLYRNLFVQGDKKQNYSKDDSLLLKLVDNYFYPQPENYNFVGRLEEVGFESNHLNQNKLEKIRKLFLIEKSDTLMFSTLCAPIFRDILVFKLQTEIQGLAQICFECGHIHFIHEKYDGPLPPPTWTRKDFRDLENLLTNTNK